MSPYNAPRLDETPKEPENFFYIPLEHIKIDSFTYWTTVGQSAFALVNIILSIFFIRFITINKTYYGAGTRFMRLILGVNLITILHKWGIKFLEVVSVSSLKHVEVIFPGVLTTLGYYIGSLNNLRFFLTICLLCQTTLNIHFSNQDQRECVIGITIAVGFLISLCIDAICFRSYSVMYSMTNGAFYKSLDPLVLHQGLHRFGFVSAVYLSLISCLGSAATKQVTRITGQYQLAINVKKRAKLLIVYFGCFIPLYFLYTINTSYNIAGVNFQRFADAMPTIISILTDVVAYIFPWIMILCDGVARYHFFKLNQHIGW